MGLKVDLTWNCLLISKILPRFERFAAHEHRIIFVLTFISAKQFYVPTMQEQSKAGKRTDKHSTFDGSIQEDIDLFDIYLAVVKIRA